MRLFDDRLEVFTGGTHLLTLPRGRAQANGKHDQVVNYHHVIHSLRKKPMALAGLVYRDKLFPRPEYRRAWEALNEALPARQACRITVELLALAHDRGCEAELAAEIGRVLQDGGLPDLSILCARFSPDPEQLPVITVTSPRLSSYEALIRAPELAEARA